MAGDTTQTEQVVEPGDVLDRAAVDGLTGGQVPVVGVLVGPQVLALGSSGLGA